MTTPTIAITPGEPAGIGPDILLMAAQQPWPARLIALTDPELLQARAEQLGISIRLVSPEEASKQHEPAVLPVQPVPLASPVHPGQLDVGNAGAVIEALQHAVDGCRAGRFDALVTGPLQKSTIIEAGIPFSGHTEYLADATETPHVVMMLATDHLRVALATTHLPLAAVPAAITADLLLGSLRILERDLRQRFGIDAPVIAVLGLNPHAGESGHLGREEIDVIIPALEQLRSEGMRLRGPLPADTAFNPLMLDECDAVFAMYHDQGLPVLKYAGFGNAVNITLGLPIIRTSVDHGTALDLAGSGRADPGSMQRALHSAIDMATRGRRP